MSSWRSPRPRRGPASIRRCSDTEAHTRSVLVISIRIISDRGSRIPEPLLMFPSTCPSEVQISQALGPPPPGRVQEKRGSATLTESCS